jgi:hypothetical protein
LACCPWRSSRDRTRRLAAPSSGDFTALVQLLADNPDGKLWPGAFATVHFHIPSDPNVLRIPATALIFGPHGMQVAKVDAENKVVLRNVQLGRNLGNYVEVSSGVSLSDRLIDSPQETIAPGDTVRIASAQIRARQGARWNKRARLKGTRRIATRRRSAEPSRQRSWGRETMKFHWAAIASLPRADGWPRASPGNPAGTAVQVYSYLRSGT